MPSRCSRRRSRFDAGCSPTTTLSPRKATHNLAYNLNAQAKYAAAQPLFEKALEIRRRLLTDDHPDTAGSYNDFAYNLNAQGKYARPSRCTRRRWRSAAACSPTTTHTPP